MYFTSWHDLLFMNHHGLFVWSAYGVALTIIVWNLWRPLVLKRRAIDRIVRSSQQKRYQQQKYQHQSTIPKQHDINIKQKLVQEADV